MLMAMEFRKRDGSRISSNWGWSINFGTWGWSLLQRNWRTTRGLLYRGGSPSENILGRLRLWEEIFLPQYTDDYSGSLCPKILDVESPKEFRISKRGRSFTIPL
jgi:hypothetical protein